MARDIGLVCRGGVPRLVDKPTHEQARIAPGGYEDLPISRLGLALHNKQVGWILKAHPVAFIAIFNPVLWRSAHATSDRAENNCKGRYPKAASIRRDTALREARPFLNE